MTGGVLTGRVALVTGAASDIGVAVCEALAELGAAIRATDLDGPRLQALDHRLQQLGASAGAFATQATDLSSPAAIEALAAEPVDILASVAGRAQVERFADGRPEEWDELWAINLRAPMLLTRAVVGGMAQRGWGRLVYVSSDSARAGAGGEAVYAATKAGLHGFAKSIAREQAADGVTANVICPGVIDTDRSRELLADRPGLREAFVRAVPMRTFGQPADVAGAIAYLCSPAARYVTGQVLSVNGGIVMG